MKALTKYQVPFCSIAGDQCREVHDWSSNIIMKDNVPFVDTLKYVEYHENYTTKSIYVQMQRMIDGSHVYLFMSDFAALITLLNDGMVHGEWAFIKRGRKYGCYLLNYLPPPVYEQ